MSQDLKRFSVSSLHSTAITSLSWSVNGLRLVSGDATGGVGLLELDYDQCQCVGRRLLTESSPVVQLDYWKQVISHSGKGGQGGLGFGFHLSFRIYESRIYLSFWLI